MRSLLVAAAILFSGTPARAATGPDNSGWPMMNGNAQHTSTSTAVGVQAPKISWVHTTPGAANPRKYMGVSLGSNGTIYAGGRSIFEAINPDGSSKWTAAETAGGAESWGSPAVGANSLVYISSPQIVYAYNINTGVFASSANCTFATASQGGGAGAVTLGPNGSVYVAHGDETYTPSFNPTKVNQYVFNQNLAPTTTVFTTTPFANERSGIVLSTDSAYVLYDNSGRIEVADAKSGLDATIFTTPIGSVFPALSIRTDNTAIITQYNNTNFCANPIPTTDNPISAISFSAPPPSWAANTIWGQCNDASASNNNSAPFLAYHAPVSSSPATNFVYFPRSARVYSLGNQASATSPGVNWFYDITSFGFTPTVGNVGPLTLAAGSPATLYFTYCASGSNTRLVALNANTGARNYDVLVSTTNCFSGQPVPTTGGRMYLYNGPDVIGLEESGAASVALSSTPATTIGDFWYSTVTVSISKAGGVPVSSGVPVELASISLSAALQASITPTVGGLALTDTSGVARFPVQWKLDRTYPETSYPSAVANFGFRIPAFATQSIGLAESRPATIAVSSATASYTSNLRVSTITFTLKDATGVGVPNVPCRVTTSGTGANSPSFSPDLTSVGFSPTNGSGVSNIVVSDDLRTLAGSSYAAYVATFTAACLDQPAQTVYLKESRVASIAVSTGVPSISGSLRVSTLTITLKDGSGAVVPNVPVVLDLVGSLATVSTATIPNTGLRFSTTNASGQVQILVDEDYGPIPNASYASMVSTFSLRVLSTPDTPVYLREQRVASVSITTGTPTVLVDGSNVPTLRVSTLTFTLKDASGAAVPNVPIWLDSSLLSYVLAPSWIGAGIMPVTNGAGQAQYLVQERVDGVALPALNNFSGLVSTVTYQVAGFPDTSVPLKEQRVASVSFSSTPAVMQGDFRVFYVTATVKDATGAGVPNVPVALSRLNFPYAGTRLTTFSPESTSSEGLAATNGAGLASIMVKQDVFNYMLAENGNGYDYAEFAVFNASYSINVPQQANVTVGGSETRAGSYTVSVSSPVIQSDVRFATITVTVLDTGGQPLPNVPVAVTTFTRAGPSAFEKLAMDTARGSSANYAGLSTDANGRATFTLKLGTIGTTFDTFDDFPASVTVVPMNLGFSTVPFRVESNKVDHYNVAVPTGTAVGVAFGSTVTAANVYNHALSSYTESGINLVPFFAGTNVQGTGTLGTSITGSFSNGSYVVPQQTYNRIENIQIKASRQSDGKSGKSGTIYVSGPDHFVITVPTGTAAGQVFVATITAVDAGGNQVVGYSATLSLSAVVWNSTGTPASGALSVTNVNMPANGVLTISNESYNKGGGIRVRAFDSAANIAGYSSSMTVTQPPMTIDHYGFQLPSAVSVGVPFRLEIDALNASSAPVSYSLDRAVNLQAFISGTGFGVAGSGSLGNSNVTIVAGSTYAVVAAQTYNKIETLQLKGTDQDGLVGASSFTLTVNGPNHFDVVMTTAAQAGQPFQVTIVARDASNNQVLGYNGTVSLAAVQAATVTLSGGGVLGVTNLNVSGGQVTTAFQTYTKTEGIRLRVSDSGIGVTSYSSSMTVTAGPPAQLSILANPQSTVAGLASVLTSSVLDLFNNPVAGSTVTFQLLTGSGTVALGINSLPSAVTSTNAVANAAGTAQAFFASTNTTSAQADVMRAAVGSLVADTTIYNAVLVGPAGGTIVNFGDPNSKAIVPAGAYGFSVRLALNEGSELAAADVAASTAAMARSPNTFVSTFTAKITAVQDSNPGASAGGASQLVTVQFPFAADASSNVQVGSFRGASLRPSSLLVPFSVMRVFKLNQATSVFEMILDGTNLPSLGSRSVSAQVTDPNGIYALGAPPFTPVSAGSSATITTPLASGATASVSVPFGAFAGPVVVQLGVPSAASVPAIPGAGGVTGTGITVSVSAGGVQPIANVGVTVGYTLGGIGNLNPNNLRMARYDPSTGWVVLDSQVDTVARTVTGQTSHFSLFQIVSISPQADASQGFAFPNPFRPSQGHATIGFANLPASTHVKVYTISGRLLRELDADTTGRVTGWDATDSSGRALPSGVYIAVFVNGNDKRTFKFAVQR